MAGVLGGGVWAVAVGMLVGVAVLLAAGPRGRSVHALTGRRGRGSRSWAGDPGAAGTDGGPGGVVVSQVRRWLAQLRGDSPGGAPSVQVSVTQVAGLLRAGMAPGPAWQSIGPVRVDPRGVPEAADLLTLVLAGRGPVRGVVVVAARRQVEAIVAACRLAAETGAPLAAVLDVIVETLVAASRAEQDRDAALAGPRSTARVLAWLPAIGVVVGTALGADPLGLVLDGGLGALALVGGLVLVGVGHRWTARLLARARTAGEPP